TRAELGVIIPDRQVAEIRGAVVQDVTRDGAAAAASIRPGEVITKVDDRLIANGDELIATIRSYLPGSQVQVAVGGPDGSDQRTVPVTLGTQTVDAAG
ncbi:MAG: PDZ domain-containing protein, partial [Pseudonocardiaceae bacterium]